MGRKNFSAATAALGVYCARRGLDVEGNRGDAKDVEAH